MLITIINTRVNRRNVNQYYGKSGTVEISSSTCAFYTILKKNTFFTISKLRIIIITRL